MFWCPSAKEVYKETVQALVHCEADRSSLPVMNIFPVLVSVQGLPLPVAGLLLSWAPLSFAVQFREPLGRHSPGGLLSFGSCMMKLPLMWF